MQRDLLAYLINQNVHFTMNQDSQEAPVGQMTFQFVIQSIIFIVELCLKGMLTNKTKGGISDVALEIH
ncbi:MAG: hypothetical protein ACP5MI_03975 [Candidatus Kryptoniota bacterium]